MKKVSINFELVYTYNMIFKYADIEFINEGKEIHFVAGDLGLIFPVDFVASRLSRIEKDLGKEVFFECKHRIDEAFENYKQSKNKKDEENNVQ